MNQAKEERDGMGWDGATGSLPWPFQSQQHGVTDRKVKGKGPVFLPTTPPTPSKHTHTKLETGIQRVDKNESHEVI